MAHHMARKTFFSEMQSEAMYIKQFNIFASRSKVWQKEIDDRYQLPKKLHTNIKRNIDISSVSLYPSDRDNNFVPVQITGDGNCLMRCGSLILFGVEELHVEIRVRHTYHKTLNLPFLNFWIRPSCGAYLGNFLSSKTFLVKMWKKCCD